MQTVFDLPFSQLPREIAIFPLPGALLLPRGRLPLNLFEPRYLSMGLDAMANQRIIGMIQPLEYQPDPLPGDVQVYGIGCAGRITSFAETEDGRLLITLKGLCRFKVTAELESRNGYRRVAADYAGYEDDMNPDPPIEVDRDRLMPLLKSYFKLHQIEVEWASIEKAPDSYLVTSLAMICPFQVGEKQALLEAPDLTETCDTLIALMEMSVRSGGSEAAKH